MARIHWWTFKCATCGSIERLPCQPKTLQCADCGDNSVAESMRSRGGNGGGVVTIDATVDGLDRHTCWVRWDENRRALEGGRGYAIHPLTDSQIVAAKLYQRGLWTIARAMKGPSKPKLTILVDQDIED